MMGRSPIAKGCLEPNETPLGDALIGHPTRGYEKWEMGLQNRTQHLTAKYARTLRKVSILRWCTKNRVPDYFRNRETV